MAADLLLPLPSLDPLFGPRMVDQFTSHVNHQSISDLKRRGLFISVHDYSSIN
ncbi:MAG: hypothetical protein PHE51_12580 [Eubacteriales bacterium]|nr:hypothetical protein [Eubacteriales bacterium]